MDGEVEDGIAVVNMSVLLHLLLILVVVKDGLLMDGIVVIREVLMFIMEIEVVL